MTEPTHHRTEAEEWLAAAEEYVDDGADNQAQTSALLAIGHAILASIAADHPDDRCPWWTNGSDWIQYVGPPSRRCTLYANHKGDHQDPPSKP